MLLVTAKPLPQSLAPRLSLSGGGAPPLRKRNARSLISMATTEVSHPAILDTVFEPFEEVKKELLLVPALPQASLARHVYSDSCEVAINDQIKYFPSFFVLSPFCLLECV